MSREKEKSQVRAWLYLLLARVELDEVLEGDKATTGDTVVLTLKFKT